SFPRFVPGDTPVGLPLFPDRTARRGRPSRRAAGRTPATHGGGQRRSRPRARTVSGSRPGTPCEPAPSPAPGSPAGTTLMALQLLLGELHHRPGGINREVHRVVLRLGARLGA